MKKVITGLLIALVVTCTVSTVHAFILIHEGVKSLNDSKDSSQEVILGHRVTSQGQFVLVK